MTNPLELTPFDHQLRTRLVFGAGCSARAGELARENGAQRVLLVTDPGIVQAGHAARIAQSLRAANLEVTIYDRVRENPTTEDVDRCVVSARAAKADMLVGLGGGSSMDTAKGCNFILTNGGRMQDYQGVGKATKPMLPFIAIPTTAGTGSECQSAALIADVGTHQKMACLDPKATARVAILDPALTLSQPSRVTACTGADALAHAVETAVTRKRNPLSLLYSHEAFKLCVRAFPAVMANPADLEARGRMLLGAAFGGVAIENSMLGAAHAAANPLTARCGIAHGQAVGIMLPHVVRFNSADPVVRAAYAELAVASGLADAGEGPEPALHALLAGLEKILGLGGFPLDLATCGVSRDLLPELAHEAAGQWTANFNPRTVSRDDFMKLYEAAFEAAAKS